MRQIKLNPPKILNIASYQKSLKDFKLPKQEFYVNDVVYKEEKKEKINIIYKNPTCKKEEDSLELF